jgi:hypothetical protein
MTELTVTPHRALIAPFQHSLPMRRTRLLLLGCLLALLLVGRASAAPLRAGAHSRSGAAPRSTAPSSSGFTGTQTGGGSAGGGEGEGSDGLEGGDGFGDGGGSSTFGAGTGSFGAASAGAPASILSPTLSAGPGGARSHLDVAEVRLLQSELAQLGFFEHVVTGWYGPVTTSAVKRFQRSAALTPDGIWGPASAAALARRLGR